MSDTHRALVEALAVITALPWLLASLYLLVLTTLAWKPATRSGSPSMLRFDLLVPAHDEALGIGDTVRSLLAVNYPGKLRRVVVIADNCVDDTAQVARQAGAIVIERHEPLRRGKGYALAAGFAWSRREGFADAVVVVDADSLVSKNLLSAFASRLEAGAMAIQATYGVRNPGASSRTRLMTIALAAFHQVRSLGRERLGLSCGLRGNGMCLRSTLLDLVPYDAFSLVEDVEYGLRLGRAGHRVVYAHEALVRGEMVSGEQAAGTQRHRWEHGRHLLRALHGWPLLRDAVVQRDAVMFDLAIDLLVPPLGQLTLFIVLGAFAWSAVWWVAGVGVAAVCAFAISFGCLIVYVGRGWAYSGTGARGLADLALAPAFVAWKLLHVRRAPGLRDTEWVRTARAQRSPR